MGSVPSLTPAQIQAINQAPNTPADTPGITTGWAAPPTPLSPVRASLAQFDNPQNPGIWNQLMNAVGQGALPKMPGTTIGAPAGGTAAAPTPPPPMLPQTQMPAPPGMGAYFRSLQQPAGAGNQGLMAQYMALQQLMRGA
jgi:hypothetical protein